MRYHVRMLEQNALQASLHSVVERGLSREPRFAEIADRWERWWRFDADRPLLIGVAPRHGTGYKKPFDVIEDPQAWLAASRLRLDESYFIDQSVPSIRVDFGPVFTAALLGARLHFALRENTSWQDPVDDPYDGPLEIDPDGKWFSLYTRLVETVSADAAGNYLVSLPDLSGATDILANLRGSEALLMDLYDRPDDVRSALPQLVDAWEYAFDRTMRTITAAGAGATSWLHAWSEVPYTVPTCDFNSMIGPDHFAEFALPYLEEQGRRAGRCLFHLDGPDAARHAEALAGSSIDAIQFTPGAGSTGAIPKIPMFRMLQEAGKPVLVICEPDEVAPVARELDPRGTVIFIDGVPDQAAAVELERSILS